MKPEGCRLTKVLAAMLCSAAAAASAVAVAQQGMESAGGAVGGDLTKFPKELQQMPALHLAHPTHAQMLSAARAGSRVVVVGDHGTVLLSDDEGKSWRQAREVPTRVLLTSVSFAGDKQGWAVGHWGAIMHTEDGGETWKLQRTDTSVDQPLFSVYFSDASNGIAVGLWSLALRTTDGGASWNRVKVPLLSEKETAGPNLYQVFPGKASVLYAAAEQGLVYRSPDGGETWTLIKTGNKGSFWTGLTLEDGGVLLAGLNGKIWRSDNEGKTWKELPSGLAASFTALASQPGGGVIAVGLEGAVATSKDGTTFTASPRTDRAPMTAVLIDSKGAPMLFSKDGVIPAN
jgi:photosystem II stability/assembly factor-like uncharacterized protein